MIISKLDADALSASFGIEMGAAHVPGPGASWGRVAPGGRSTPDRHDETEVVVVVQGAAEISVDGRVVEAAPGTVAVFGPFETHVIANPGTEDVIFFSMYWRDPAQAVRAATAANRQGFEQRPVFVFSTPPTPNGDLHLGHLSGPYLGADAYTRFQRMNGVQAWHLTGSDDYQSYVVDCARREGREPADTAAHYSAEIRQTLRLMDIDVDQYTVTDQDDTYRPGLQQYFSRILATGRVTRRATPALFDSRTGGYLYEVSVSGACPGCSAPTNGNICEDCGEPNVCADLGEPVSRVSDAPVRQAETERYTLPLHEFRETVGTHHRGTRAPARLRELAERVFARPALDLPISHPASWGVPPVERDGQGEVIWVWPEMAYGFLHGIELLGGRLGRGWTASDPEPDWKLVHFFGFDNSFYHALLYPVLYSLSNPAWSPDIDYHVNEFYLLDGAKFSTSRRHAIWGKQILRPDTVDGVRFHLARTRPETGRSNFTLAEYQATVRDVLIESWQLWLNDLGARVAADHGGRAPDAGTWTPEHTAMLRRLSQRLSALTGHLGQDGFSLNRAAAELDDLVTDIRRFVAAEAVVGRSTRWASEARTSIALELAAARLLATAAAPVMPRFAAALAGRLGLSEPIRWPHVVELLPPGSIVDLADVTFFAYASDPLPDMAGAAAGQRVPDSLSERVQGAGARAPERALDHV